MQELTPDEAERARRFAHYLAHHPAPDVGPRAEIHRPSSTTSAYDMRAPEPPSK